MHEHEQTVHIISNLFLLHNKDEELETEITTFGGKKLRPNISEDIGEEANREEKREIKIIQEITKCSLHQNIRPVFDKCFRYISLFIFIFLRFRIFRNKSHITYGATFSCGMFWMIFSIFSFFIFIYLSESLCVEFVSLKVCVCVFCEWL